MSNISIVGIGMGNINTLTVGVLGIVKKADVVIGARRMVESLEQYIGYDEFKNIEKHFAIAPQKIADIIFDRELEKRKIVVLMSGDTGFFSGTKKLGRILSERGIKYSIEAGISSISYLSSKVGISWGDMKIVSLHGRGGIPESHVMENEKTFFLLDKKMTPDVVAKLLCKAGLKECKVTVGENLSYEDEKITIGTAQMISDMTFDALSVMIVENEEACNRKKTVAPGICDDEFIRGKVPMTKEEIRTISISKLNLCEDDVAYDVGAGTGSVAVEMALIAKYGKVYAIETNEEAVELIEKNKAKFKTHNLEIIQGLAPHALRELPPPNKVFIGGSKGNMEEIIKVILEKNPDATFVINAIALETLSEVQRVFDKFEFSYVDIVQIGATRTKKVAKYTMLDAINPIFIAVGKK